MGFNGLSFWQETGLDPLLLGQPKLWVTSSNINYLQNASSLPPANGDLLNRFLRYNDSGLNPLRISNTNRATYNIISGQTHPYGYLNWNLNITSTGNYSGGTNTDFSFMHLSGGSSTVYWIFKNNTSENTATSKAAATTITSSNDNGFILYIANNGATLRTPTLLIYRGSGGTSTLINTLQDYDRTVDYPVSLYSWRTDLTKSIGQDACWSYINGKLNNTTQIINTPSSVSTSFSPINIGNRAIGGIRFMGYIGDLIIFDGIHDEATHLKICNYLKDKWRIS